MAMSAPTEGSRGTEQHKRQQVRSHNHQRLVRMCQRDDGIERFNDSIASWVLNQYAEHTVPVLYRRNARYDFYFKPKRLSSRLYHFNRLGMAIARNHESIGAPLAVAVTKGHGFCCRRGFVQQGAVGDLETCQLGDHGLKVKEKLEPPLRNLGLVRV